VWQEGIIELWGPFPSSGAEGLKASVASENPAEEDDLASCEGDLCLVTIWDPVSRYSRLRFQCSNNLTFINNESRDSKQTVVSLERFWMQIRVKESLKKPEKKQM
jgi:hypothetical protein